MIGQGALLPGAAKEASLGGLAGISEAGGHGAAGFTEPHKTGQNVKAGRAEGRNPWCQKRGLSGHNIHRGGASRANGQGWDTWMMIRPVRKISLGGLAAFLAPGERADELNAVNGSRRHD